MIKKAVVVFAVLMLLLPAAQALAADGTEAAPLAQPTLMEDAAAAAWEVAVEEAADEERPLAMAAVDKESDPGWVSEVIVEVVVLAAIPAIALAVNAIF